MTMFGTKKKQKKEDKQKAHGKRNMPVFVVVLVILLIMPLFLIGLSVHSVMSNSVLYFEQMEQTAATMSEAMDGLMDQMTQTENDFFTINKNQLSLAEELYEKGEFINHPENIRAVFGDTDYYVADQNGIQVAGLNRSPLEAGELSMVMEPLGDMKEAIIMPSSEGFLCIKRMSDGNFIYSIDSETRDNQFFGSVGGLEDMLMLSNEDHTAIIVSMYDTVMASTGYIGLSEGDDVNEKLTMLGAKIKLPGQDQTIFVATINNVPYFFVEPQSNRHQLTLYYGLNLEYLLKESFILVGIIFLSVLFELAIIMYFIRTFRKVHFLNDPAVEKELKFKSLALMIAAVGITAVSCFYAKTLLALKTYVLNDDEELSSIEDRIEYNRIAGEELQKQFSEVYSEQTEIMANYLSLYPEERTKERLKDFSKMFGLQYSILFDQNGNELISDADYITLSLSKNKNDMSSQFWSVLNGTPVLAGEIGTDDLTGLRHQLIGARIHTADNQPDGFLMSAYSSDAIDAIMKSFKLETILEYQSNSQMNDYILIDPETKDILYSPYYIMNGENAEDIGFGEQHLQEGYSGSIKLFDTKYAITQKTVDDKYLYVALPYSRIYGNRLGFSMTVGLSALVVFLIGAFLMQRVKMKEATEKEAQRFVSKKSTSRDHILNKNLYAEEKTTKLIGKLMGVFGLILFFVLLFRNQMLSSDSIIIYVLNGSWRPGLNIFALTGVLILILITTVVVRFIKLILSLSMRIASPQSETYLRLAKSAVEYLSVLICGYVSFVMLGVKMETLLATSSVMALLVGMGAQDLTEDIIAGLFLMFESEFQIGDVIDINGKIGTVKEIGLHSTKLIDENNNLLLLNNSNVRNIINRTKNTSMTFSTFTLSTDVSIRELEKIFAEELPPLKDKHPQFVKAPFFMGVDKFNGGSMECTVAAETMEDNRDEAEQILNSEVQIILMRHEITIG